MTSRLLLGTTLVVFTAACSQPAAPPPPPPPAAAAPAVPSGPVAPPTTDEAKIASALSAGPEAVTKGATILDMNEKGDMRTLRAGTNGWTCLPDMPTSPGADPMCVDKNGAAWVMALVSHKNPPKEKLALGYMLAGGSDASNEDPFAEKPHQGDAWIETGPHLMVFNIGTHFDGYPTTHDNTKVPYVMWGKTPYAHIMVPVE